MKLSSWLITAAIAAVVVAAGFASPVSAMPPRAAMVAAPGGLALALVAVSAWRIGRVRAAPALDSSLTSAVPEWRAGRRAALEGMVAEFAGPAATAHALRCATLAVRLAGQLALSQEETDDLALAASLHVLPIAFPHAEDATAESCDFDSAALSAAWALLQRVGPGQVAGIAAEVGERWDGSGRPNRLAREECSLSGRILAAACAFDHASAAGLSAGLDAVRRGSGTAFDPVIVSELVYLFMEPWQKRLTA